MEDIHVHVHLEPDPRMAEALRLLRRLVRQGETIMADLTDITAAVEENTTVEESAIVLLTQLADALEAAGTDPAALAALTDQIRGESANLAAAVAANTPAAPPGP